MAERIIADLAFRAETTLELGCSRNFIKKSYNSLTILPIEVTSSGQILIGSKADVSIAPNIVDVENYIPGFEDGTADHNDIGFVVEF